MLRLSGNKAGCCSGHSPGRRFGITSATGWLLPSAFLVLIPKCPLCVAAYFAAATGIGISISTAAGVRYAMIGSCFLMLLFTAVRSTRKWGRMISALASRSSH